MKCREMIRQEQSESTKLIKRRFVPLRVLVQSPGQFVTAQVKLPFKTDKIVGVLVTSRLSSVTAGKSSHKELMGKTCILEKETFKKKPQ